MSARRFPIRIGPRSRRLVRILFGATPESAWAELDADRFRARFGWFWIETGLDNVASWRIEGPFRWITAIGVRKTIRGGDLSFGGSPRGFVRLALRRPIRPGRVFHVPAVWVGVEDLDGLAAALAAAGIPGHDARRS